MFDPEKVHHGAVRLGRILGSNFVTRWLTRFWFGYSNSSLEQSILGIDFKNPVGLTAGFDKEGALVGILPEVGFGFMEAGSITGEFCEGNEKPRLWRLKKSLSLVVHMGLNSSGCEKVAERFKKLVERSGRLCKIPVGLNVAKTNCVATSEIEVGIQDYLKAFKALQEYSSYMTVNISCPNAGGGQPFTKAENLEKLLSEIDVAVSQKPVFLKMPPDLEIEDLDAVLAVTDKHKIAGLICSNLTKNRENRKVMSKVVETELPVKGGISGKPVEELANNLIAYVYKKYKRRYVIIGVGGIFCAEDAYKKIKLGASLVALVTGMIFEGPQLISDINLGLVELMKKDGFKNIGEAVGAENKLA